MTKEKEKGELDDGFGKNYIDRLYNVYVILWTKKYGLKPILSYAMVGRIMKDLVKSLTEKQIALLLIVYFDWKGADGNDTFIEKKLQNSTHSIFLFNRELNSIRAYIQNVMKVDMEDESQLDSYINNLIEVN